VFRKAYSIFENSTDQKLVAMKTISTLILAVIFIGFAGCTTPLVEDTSIESPKEITAFQQYMLDDINFARTNPVGYADSRLKEDYGNSTDNGSYLYFKNTNPVGLITFNNSLNLSASNYATLLAEKNLAEHNADGTPLKRAIRAGYTGTSTGENIAIASENSFNAILNPQTAAIFFVRVMIIDEGVEDIGHRLIILSPKYKAIGIGFTQNSTTPLLNYVVQDFGNL